jgi:NADH-quinone oxidoreductase subunit J
MADAAGVLDLIGAGALGALAIVLGVAVFVVDSMARATFALLGSFVAVAGLLWWLGLVYLGAVTVLMMTVEMAVMAVFMVAFMMNPAGLMPMTMVHAGRAAAGVATALFVVLVTGVWLTDWTAVVSRARAAAADPGMDSMTPVDGDLVEPTLQVGRAVMGSHMLVMLVVGVTLLATIVAATVLATDRGRYDRFGDDLSRRRPDDPVSGGLPR